MSTITTAEEAHEEVARRTGAYLSSEAIVYDYLKVIRAVKHVIEDLRGSKFCDDDAIAALQAMAETISDMRSQQSKISMALGNSSDTLMQQIQHGVFNG